MPIEHVSVSGEVTWGLKGTLGDERYWCEGIYAPSSRRPYTHVGNAAIDEHKVVTIGPGGGGRSVPNGVLQKRGAFCNGRRSAGNVPIVTSLKARRRGATQVERTGRPRQE